MADASIEVLTIRELELQTPDLVSRHIASEGEQWAAVQGRNGQLFVTNLDLELLHRLEHVLAFRNEILDGNGLQHLAAVEDPQHLRDHNGTFVSTANIVEHEREIMLHVGPGEPLHVLGHIRRSGVLRQGKAQHTGGMLHDASVSGGVSNG